MPQFYIVPPRQLVASPLGGGVGVTRVEAGAGLLATPINPITTEGTLAIDQTFSPTWTNLHTFSGGLTTSTLSVGALSGVLRATAGVVSGGAGLTHLSDTNIVSPQDGEVVKYNALSGKWVNGTVDLPANIVFTTGTQTITGEKTFSAVLNAAHSLKVGNQTTALSASGNYILLVHHQFTQIDAHQYGQYIQADFNPSADTSRLYYANYASASTTAGNAFNFTNRVVAFQGQVNHNAASTITQVRGFAGVISNAGGGTIATAYGGFFGLSNTSGTITTGHGLYVQNFGGGGTYTSRTSMTLEAASGGTNNTTLLIGTNSVPAGSFAFYSASTNPSYFAGALQVNGTLTIQSLSGVLKASAGAVSGGGGLSDLADVSLSSPQNNDVLRYNTSTSRWENAAPSGGGGTYQIVDLAVSANTTLTASTTVEYIVIANGSNTITLPSAASHTKEIMIRAKGGSITVQRAGSDTIEGATSLSMSNAASYAQPLLLQGYGGVNNENGLYRCVTLVSNGTNGWVVAESIFAG